MTEQGAWKGQMNHFPYAQLHTIRQRETDAQWATRPNNVLVYLDRITEPDGRELVQLSVPALYQSGASYRVTAG